MTHRSSLRGFIAIPNSMGDANKPVSTGRHRFLVDNGLHLADQCGRVLCDIQWPTPLNPLTSALSEFSEIILLGPFRLTVDPDGVAYPIRIRIGGATDGKAGTVSFRAVLGSQEAVRRYFNSSGGNVTDTGTTATSTQAWLTTGSTLLTMTAQQTSECLATDAITDGGAIGDSGICYKAMIGIYGKRASSLAEPALGAVYAAEYVGV